MSNEPAKSSNNISDIIGKVFLFLVPASLVAMLGFIGVSFVGATLFKGGKPEEAEASEPAPAVAAAAPAPQEGGAAPAEAAPAPETAAAETPAPEGGAAASVAVDPEVMALGKTSYATCAACHGPDGKGLKAGPALMAPSLVGSELLMGDPELSLLVVLKGIQKENMDFMGVMAPLGAALDDQKLAAVLTYTRNEWGNSAPPVTTEQAAAARAKFSAVDAPAGVKRSEIEKVVAEHK